MNCQCFNVLLNFMYLTENDFKIIFYFLCYSMFHQKKAELHTEFKQFNPLLSGSTSNMHLC